MLCEQDGKLEPTNAYAILTGSGVVRSVVQCGVFKGSTKAVFVDRREFTGTPQELIEASYQYVLRNIHMGARFKGVYRQDVYEIPPEAIRELIVNAVVHRSYIDHSSIQIAIYDDRLEITSPGRLPMGQTIERMKQGYSKIRNEALALAFEYMGYIEHWGSGILRVMQQVRDAGLPEPEFLGGDTDLRINIYRTNVNLSSDDAITTRLRRDLSSDDAITTRLRRDSSSDDAIAEKEFANEQDSRKLILDEIRNREWITTADAVRILGIQKRQVQRMLKDLIDEGFVARLGSGPSTRYVALSKKEETHE